MLASAQPNMPTTPQELIGPELGAQLDRLDLLSRKVFAGKLQGERRSRRRGRSVEFDDYREYAAGDDLRHVDWNVLARLDRFFIKIFQEEEDLALHVVIDASGSMYAGSPAKIVTAARIAAALGYIGLANNNRVLMTVLGQGRRARLEPLRGRRNLPRLLRFVLDRALTPPPGVGSVAPDSEFTAGLRGVAADPGGKGVVLVLSDLLIAPGPATPPGEAGYEAGLRVLAGSAIRPGAGTGAADGGLDLYVVQILSPGELDPAAEGRPASTTAGASPRSSPLVGDVRLEDAETGRTADVTITPTLLRHYRERVGRYISDAAAFCRARGLHHMLAPSDAPVDRLVAGALRRAGMLR